MPQSKESSLRAQLGIPEPESKKDASVLFVSACPEALRLAEIEFLKQRPKWQEQKEDDPQKADKKVSDPPKLVGFGLSGGGIRSATFCLGVFQGLAKLGLLGQIDYISSVSGGSYFASFYGRLFTRPDISGIDEIKEILSPNGAERMSVRKSGAWKAGVFDWLRENGRYLAPKGGGDLLLGIAVFLRNWLTIQLIMGIAVLALFLVAQLLRVVGENAWTTFSPVFSARVLGSTASAALSLIGLSATGSAKVSNYVSNLIHRTPAVPYSQGHFWWSPYVMVAAAMALLSIVPLGWAYWMFRLPEPDPSGAATGDTGRPISILAILAMLTFFIAIAVIASQLPDGAIAVTGIVAAGADIVLALVFLFWATKVKFSQLRTQPAGIGDARLQFIRTLEDEALVRSEQARNWLSAMLRTALVSTVAVLAFGLIDSAGETLYATFFCIDCHPVLGLSAVYGALVAAAPFAQWVVASLLPKKKNKHLSMPLGIIAGVGAAAVILPVLVGLDLFSHAIAFDFAKPADAPAALMAPATAARVEVAVKLVNDVANPNPSNAESKGAPCQVSMERGSPVITCKNAEEAHRKDTRIPQDRSACPLELALALAFLLSCFVGMKGAGGKHGTSSQALVFLNRSSLHAIYTSRLIRAYLGASNKSRYQDGGKGVSDVVKGDDISQQRYWIKPEDFFYQNGAPLHLVNSTLNETIDGESQIEQRDRKGLGMAVGPAGLSVGVRHHAVYDEPRDPQKIMVEIFPRPADGEFRVFDYKEDHPVKDSRPRALAEFKGEQLSLGNWTGVSGAAAATGMGFRTSLGLSLLTGFFNVRLGYWWDSGIKSRRRGEETTKPTESAQTTKPTEPTETTKQTKPSTIGYWLSRMLPVQGYLLDELLARFHGTARRYWYLSDGGNFENLGGYELIRRRLPLIVIIDAAADPNYEFEDLAGLVLKARLDFNAEIDFLDDDEIKDILNNSVRQWYGPLEEMRRGRRADEPSPIANGQRTVFFKSSNTARYSLKHAAVARVRYLDDPAKESLLILIKPTLVGDEPADVLEYHNSHPAFPQEGTANQFFDEAQWESYRRLGQHIAKKIFAPPDKGGFLPDPNRGFPDVI